MRSTIRARAGRILAIVGLIAAALAPATGSVHAATGDLILKVGTDQEFSGLNPWQAVYVLDYEVFTLNYDLLVGYDKNLGYTEGFATSWTTSEDGKTTTFKVRPGMKWSDGEPATADDAEYTYQLVLDALAEETTLGSGLPRRVRLLGRRDKGRGDRPRDPRRHDRDADPAPPRRVRSHPAQAHLGEVLARADRQRRSRRLLRERSARRRDRPLPGR